MINFIQLVFIVCGLVFIGLGLTFRNVSPNNVIGIKTKWTLSSEIVWEKTHELGAILWIIGGALLVGNIFVKTQTVFVTSVLFSLVLVIVVPTLYSYYLSRQLEKM